MTLAQGEYDKECVSFGLNTKLLQPDIQLSQQLELVPNHCLHRATGSISSALSIPRLLVDEIDHCCLKTLIEDFLNFLNPNSSVTLSSACLSCLHATCTLCVLSFHHDDCATVMFCMHLSTYSTAK